MATQIDARVKQKTGTEADFAGYNLLEGEIALVRTSANGPVFNFKVGPGNFDELDWSLQNPGAAVAADTSTVFPAGVPGLYIPTESGTYDGITVDLSAGYTQLIWDGTTLVKAEFPIDLAGYAAITDLNNMYKVKYYDFNKRVDTSDGSLSNSDQHVTTSDLIRINPNEAVSVRRGTNGGQSVFFYDVNGDFISAVSIGSGTTGSAIPPPGAVFARINISTSLSTRWDDIAAFGIYQAGYAPEELPTQTTTTDSTNLYDPANGYDDHYVIGSNGYTDSGASSPRTDYVLGFLILESGQTHLSYRRRSTPGSLGAFYDEDMSFISGVSGVSGVDNGTIAIPSGAVYFLFNVSNNPAQRQQDKDGFTLVYGEDVPDNIPPKRVITIGGRSIQPPNVVHPWFNKLITRDGDSIAAYARNPNGSQDFNNSFIARAIRDMGAIELENKAVGGTTIAQSASNPGDRTPLVTRYMNLDASADMVIINAGTNDWNYTWTPIGTESDTSPNTLYGALNIILPGLRAMFGAKPIIWILPFKRNFQLSSTPDAVNGNGMTLQEYADIIEERCRFWGITTFDMGKNSGINPFIPEHVDLYINDGTHPNQVGSQIAADRLVAFLRSV